MYVPRGGVDKNDRNVLGRRPRLASLSANGDTANTDAIAVFPPGKVRMPAFLCSAGFALGELNWINLGKRKHGAMNLAAGRRKHLVTQRLLEKVYGQPYHHQEK